MLIVLMVVVMCIINLRNPLFYDYIVETRNYFLLFFPLTHEYIYKHKQPIAFVSTLFGAVIAVYVEPKYRKRQILKKHFQHRSSSVITNNARIIDYLIKHNALHVIDLPYFHLFKIFE